LCRAHLQLKRIKDGERWCDELLRMSGGERDIDGLLGKGEALLAREEWEEAVRAFEHAWDASGRGNHEVRRISLSLAIIADTAARSTLG